MRIRHLEAFGLAAAMALLGLLFLASPVDACLALTGGEEGVPSVQSSGQVGTPEAINVAVIGLSCLLLLALLGVGVIITLLLGSKKPRRQRFAGSVPTRRVDVPSPAPVAAEIDWRADTILRVPSAARMALVVTRGANVGQRHRLVGSNRVGRASDNEVVVPDPQVSRHHAVITFNGSQFEVTDLGGANGTEVNGRTIKEPTLLQVGDVITIGGHALTLQGE